MTNKISAIKIIKELRKRGFESFLAGGCVRDMILHKSPKDYDVATSATPQQVSQIFNRTLKIGAKFGVVIVLIDGSQVEVATFRKDQDYKDGRHPASVEFAAPAVDAARRDFTINGMFYDPLEKKIIDYVNGQDDLKKRIIKTIGNPVQRFAEDYLRMFRAVRFSTRLGFAISPETWDAISANAKNITKISAERIAMELEAVLVDPNRAEGVKMLYESGLLCAVFPCFKAEDAKLGEIVSSYLKKQIDFPLALAALFAGWSTPEAMKNAKMLKLSRNQYRHLRFLLENRDVLLDKDIGLAKLKMLMSQPYFDDLLAYQWSIQTAKGESKTALRALKKRIKQLGDVELKPLPFLNGHQLIELGVAKGPVLGQIAREMYIAQLEGELSQADQAKKWVKRWMKKHKDADL